MNSLEGRIEVADGRPIVKTTGVSVDDVVRRLEAGEPTVMVAAGEPFDLIAALAFAALGDDGSEGCALVQEPPSRPRLDEALSPRAMGRLFPHASQVALLALSAGLLQIHDFWEPSHEAAQEADDLGERRFSAYWHAIAHRREPDPGNAAYWFRRVGKHPLFPALAEAAADLLHGCGLDGVAGRMARSDGWDPAGMIDLCTGAKAGSRPAVLARRLQRLEMWLLLAATAEAAAS
jgi:uncharacterized protein (DUF433 family)